jgi:hypothetical protein
MVRWAPAQHTFSPTAAWREDLGAVRLGFEALVADDRQMLDVSNALRVDGRSVRSGASNVRTGSLRLCLSIGGRVDR